jgi:hypothetical protein
VSSAVARGAHGGRAAAVTKSMGHTTCDSGSTVKSIHQQRQNLSNPLVKSIVSLSWLEQKHHGGGPEEEEPAVEKLAQERMPRVRLGSGACAEPTATCSRALPLHPNPASATAGETKAVTMRGG